MKTRIPFDTELAIATAWDLLWARNIKMRAEGQDYDGQTYYLTASDVERQVRAFAEEQMEGKPWGSSGNHDAYYSRIRISGDLNNAVRDWLLWNHNLQQFNFKRGHISGMRFRPVGEPFSPQELRTQAAQKKEADARAAGKKKPVHYSGRTFGNAICVKRSPYSSGIRSSAYTTRDPAKVTCPRCLKMLAANPELAAAYKPMPAFPQVEQGEQA